MVCPLGAVPGATCFAMVFTALLPCRWGESELFVCHIEVSKAAYANCRASVAALVLPHVTPVCRAAHSLLPLQSIPCSLWDQHACSCWLAQPVKRAVRWAVLPSLEPTRVCGCCGHPNCRRLTLAIVPWALCGCCSGGFREERWHGNVQQLWQVGVLGSGLSPCPGSWLRRCVSRL